MGEKVNAFYGLTGDGKTAVIEMAAASGLMLVAPARIPFSNKYIVTITNAKTHVNVMERLL